jgi:thiamine-monophosphate kinase
VIDAQSIPLSAAAATLLARSAVGIEALVSGGDDYEILCAISENRSEAFEQAARLAGVAVTSIGTVIAGPSIPRFLDGAGRDIALPRLSYSHF